MYSDELKQKEEPIELEIHPLTKWKRMLVFLADYFLSFILAFAVLNVMIVPIFAAATNANARGEAMRVAEADRQSVLYGHKLLFYENNDENRKDYSVNLKYTFYRFLSYYVLDENIQTYGPNIENEVFYHFYNDIRLDKATYVDYYNKQNQGYNYFVYDESKPTLFYLKNEVRNELKMFYIYPDESLSNEGNQMMDNMANFFTVLYKAMLDNVNEKDLVFNNVSYVKSLEKYQQLQTEDHWIMTICLLITHVLCWGVVYLLIPLLSKTGKTIGMRVCKAERVDYKKLSTFRKRDVVLASSYALFLNLSYLFFLPLTFSSSGFVYVLSLPLITIFAILSLVLIIASFIILMVTNFNRTFSDLASFSVMVQQDDLDAIYRYKGYYK